MNTIRKRPASLPQYQAPSGTGSASRYSNTPASRSPASERTVVINTKIGRIAIESWI